MSERKMCVRCSRTIDQYARICPFCNWDQSAPVPAVAPRTVATDYTPPEDTRPQRYLMGGIGGALLVIVLFLVGAHLHRSALPATPAEPQAAPGGPTSIGQRTNVTLVPDNGPAPPQPDQPITSAPASDSAQGLSSQTDRTDATAASSAEYTQMAQRAAAETARKKRGSNLVDPMSIQGNAYGNPAPHSMASSSTIVNRRVTRTPPIPEYQGIPDIGVRDNVTARLQLTIGPDGRVSDINVLQALPGRTPQLVHAVQAWRFRPATQNGVPVSSTFTTALSFRQR
jgi:protein TonB